MRGTRSRAHCSLRRRSNLALKVSEVLCLCQAITRSALLLPEGYAALLQARLRSVSKLLFFIYVSSRRFILVVGKNFSILLGMGIDRRVIVYAIRDLFQNYLLGKVVAIGFVLSNSLQFSIRHGGSFDTRALAFDAKGRNEKSIFPVAIRIFPLENISEKG